MDDEHVAQQIAKNYIEKINKESNTISTVFKVFTCIVFFLAFICLCVFLGEPTFATGLALLSFLLSGFIFMAIAELLQILHDIRRKLYKEK